MVNWYWESRETDWRRIGIGIYAPSVRGQGIGTEALRLWTRYLFDTTEPLFPFGYGLSYTTFAYANLRVAPARIGTAQRTTVSVDVTNTGHRSGDEVVQLYIRDVVSTATRPVKELRGFRRVTLQPGETRTVTFEIGPEQLAYHGPDMKRVVEPGRFDVMVGGNSVDVSTVALDVVEQP
jgi:beta-glucosidase